MEKVENMKNYIVKQVVIPKEEKEYPTCIIGMALSQSQEPGKQEWIVCILVKMILSTLRTLSSLKIALKFKRKAWITFLKSLTYGTNLM